MFTDRYQIIPTVMSIIIHVLIFGGLFVAFDFSRPVMPAMPLAIEATLVSEDAPSRTILGAGAGSFAVTKVHETRGISLFDEDLTPENVAARFAEISDTEGQEELQDAFSQTKKYTFNAAEARGLKLDW